MIRVPLPLSDDWKTWSRQLTSFLSNAIPNLGHKTDLDNPSQNGTLLWYDVNEYPVISKNGEWRQIVLEDGHYNGAVSSDQTAAAIDTAYALTYTSSTSDSISNDATNPSRIVFSETGEYMISFSAQISAGSSSSVDFYFWPRVNGTDAAGSTMVNTLKNNGARLVVSRTAIFTFAAGDYLEAMWAVSDTNGFLDATAATAFCPAAPASTIAITRMHG